MPLKLIQQILRHAHSRPDALAGREIFPGENGRCLSYSQLIGRMGQVAGWIDQSPGPGSVVLLCCPNHLEYLAAFTGILAAGGMVFPLSPDLAGREIIEAIEQSKGSALIASGEILSRIGPSAPSGLMMLDAAQIPHLPPGEIDSLAADPYHGGGMFLQSSGTTGPPRIVRRDGAALDAVCANMVRSIGFGADDRILAAVPLCHSYGVEHGLLAPLWAGAAVHLSCGFDLAAAQDQLAHGGVTIFPGVPFMFEMLARHGDAAAPFAHLRRTYCAGGPLPAAIYEEFLRRYGIRISQLYGATELGSITFNDPDLSPFNPASVGRPMEGVKIRILRPGQPDGPALHAGEEGEVAIAAGSMMSEYLNAPSPFVEGYFPTGDLGKVEPDGGLVITGRLKFLIDVGGRKVNPLEVEAVLNRHPTVAECCVVRLPVSATASRLKAVIVPRPQSIPSSEELRHFARQYLAGWKIPRRFELAGSLPRSSNGKILRRRLEENPARAPVD